MNNWIKNNWHLLLLCVSCYLGLIFMHSMYKHYVIEPRELAKLHTHSNKLMESKWIKCQIANYGEIILNSEDFEIIDNNVQLIKNDKFFSYDGRVCEKTTKPHVAQY